MYHTLIQPSVFLLVADLKLSHQGEGCVMPKGLEHILRALEYALPDIKCGTVSSAYTSLQTSSRPDPLIIYPMLPIKLIKVWKPKRHAMLRPFSAIIPCALYPSG